MHESIHRIQARANNPNELSTLIPDDVYDDDIPEEEAIDFVYRQADDPEFADVFEILRAISREQTEFERPFHDESDPILFSFSSSEEELENESLSDYDINEGYGSDQSSYDISESARIIGRNAYIIIGYDDSDIELD